MIKVSTVFIRLLPRARGRGAKNCNPRLESRPDVWYIKGRDKLFLKNDRFPNISITINRFIAERLSMIEGHVFGMFT